MAAATGLTIVKEMTYRDNTNEQWSNRYWLTGVPPASSAAWRTLFDQLVAAERTCYTQNSKVVGGYGYDDNTPGAHAVWGVDLEALGQTQPGSLLIVPGMNMAGDQAGMIEWRTERKSTRGKWIYLRKYFHGGNNHATIADNIDDGTNSAYQTFATALFTGTGATGRKVRSQKQDEVLTFAFASPYVTTRTLKRRGKRP